MTNLNEPKSKRKAQFRRYFRLLIQALLLVIAVFLPVIPVQTAPVLPNPNYHLNYVSLYEIYQAFDGVHHRMEWYSYLAAVIFFLLAFYIGALASWLLDRILRLL